MPHNTIRRFDSTGEAYDACQTGEAEKGDLLWIPSEGVVGVADTWPFAVTCQYGKLHVTDDSPEAAAYLPDAVAAAVKLAQALGLQCMAHLLPVVELPADDWIPACGGTERPFVCNGRRLQYMWNRGTGQHAYYDCEADMFLTTEDAFRTLNA